MRRVPPVLFVGSAGILLAAVLPLTAARAAAAPPAPPAPPAPAGTSQPPAGVGGGSPFPVPPTVPVPAKAAPAAVPAGRVPAEVAGLPADATAGEAQATQDLAVEAARRHGHRVVVDSLSGDRKTTFAEPNGTLTEVSYPTPVFHTESGHRVRTDPSIISVGDATYPRQAPHAVRPLAIGTDTAHLLRWDLPTGRITVRLAPADTAAPSGISVPSPLPAAAVSTTAGHVLLAGALPHADLDISSRPTGPQVDLVLADASAPRTLALLLDDPTGALGGLGAATPRGGWRFPANGGQYAITPPYAYQQAPAGNGQVLPPDPSSAHLTVTVAGAHSYLVTETVDSAWLAGKTFPVVLDPTIVDQYENAMWDCQLFDGSYQNNNYCPYGTSYYDAASNVGYTARALLRPDISVLTNGGTYLRQAYFALYATGSDSNATHVHDLCAGGTFWGNGPNTTWANTAGGAPRGDQCVSFDATPNTYYRGVDVTPATRAALANQFPYYGFVLKNDSETWGYQYTQFDGAGGQHPSYFVINYGLPPSAPQNVTASINNAGTFTATWDTPAGSADADPVDGYTGYLYQCGHSGQDMVAGAWITETSGPKTWTYNINPSQCYYYLLFPHNDAGYNNNATVNALAQTYAQAPTLTSVRGGVNAVSGTVNYPGADGADGRMPFSSTQPYAVNSYLLFLYPTGQSWPTSSPISCQSVSANGNQPTDFAFDLSHGSASGCASGSYVPIGGADYTVEAFPANGSGASATVSGVTESAGYGTPALSTSVTAVALPGPAGGVAAVAGDGGAIVWWTAAADNGSGVADYTVTATPGGATVSSTGNLVTAFPGLTNGVGYTFTVTATNDVGTGTASSPSNAVVPLTGGINATSTVETSWATQFASTYGARVPIPSLTTSTSATFAEPDGTLTTELAPATANVKANDGSYLGLDANLVQDGSTLRPAVSALGITLGTGGTQMDSVTDSQNHTMTFSWPTNLPAPTTSGDTATYANAATNTDLLIRAQPGGIDHSLLVKAAGVQTYRFHLDVSAGLTAALDSGNNLVISDAAGNLVYAGPPATMNDSQVDTNSGLPSNTGPVTTSLTPSITGGYDITLVPDAGFMTSSSTVFPVTIDPPVTLTQDTYLFSNAAKTAEGGSKDLRVGTYNASGGRARALVQFNTDAYKGKPVSRALLQMYAKHSWNCNTPKPVLVYRATTPWRANTAKWGTDGNTPSIDMPSVITSKSFAAGDNCAGGEKPIQIDVTAHVQAWTSTTSNVSNYGLELRSDENDVNAWKIFGSSEAGGDQVPKLLITQPPPPAPPTPPGKGSMPPPNRKPSGSKKLWGLDTITGAAPGQGGAYDQAQRSATAGDFPPDFFGQYLQGHRSGDIHALQPADVSYVHSKKSKIWVVDAYLGAVRSDGTQPYSSYQLGLADGQTSINNARALKDGRGHQLLAQGTTITADVESPKNGSPVATDTGWVRGYYTAFKQANFYYTPGFYYNLSATEASGMSTGTQYFGGAYCAANSQAGNGLAVGEVDTNSALYPSGGGEQYGATRATAPKDMRQANLHCRGKFTPSPVAGWQYRNGAGPGSTDLDVQNGALTNG